MVCRLANFKQFDALVVVLTDVPVMDFTSCRALDDMISDTLAVIRKVFLVYRRPKLKTYLDKHGIFKKLQLDSIHSERSPALCAAARSIDLDPELCKSPRIDLDRMQQSRGIPALLFHQKRKAPSQVTG